MSQQMKEVLIPDLGGAAEVTVIDILVKPGDRVQKEDGLITLESEKASMDVPAPEAGIVQEIRVKKGDQVSEGSLVLILQVDAQAASAEKPAEKAQAKPTAAPSAPAKPKPAPTVAPVYAKSFQDVHAGPSVRQLARELGVDLTQVPATGPKGRILKEDLYAFVKQQLQKSQGGLQIAPAPMIDFTKFGEIDIQPLNKIKRYTAINVHRSWVTIPHVTQFEEADITDLEAMRKQKKAEFEAQGVKLTPLIFIMKAVVAGLKQFPIFNSSLDTSGENLIYKKYFNIGIAVDTPNGLVVPVIRNVDQKSIVEIAKELAEISNKARVKGLTPAEMSGSCFTISSLGGIGGTAFTPIVNAPDVAILGVSKSQMQPVYQNNQFVPRLMLPLSLSYDHRVIDGADGARFVVFLAQQLANPQNFP